MFLRNRMKNGNTIMLAGMAFLILSSLSRFLHANDFVFGLLQGITIALLLLSILVRRGAGCQPSVGAGST